MDTIQCPACGSINPIQEAVCHECNEDLNTVKSVLDTANRHYNEALALAQSGNLDEATGQLEAAIAMSAQNPNYHLLLGTVSAQKQDWDEAIRAWERCLTITPEMEKAYRNIEKANQMRDEEEHERQQRPYFLLSIASVAVAGLLLFTTAFYAYQSYSKNGQIAQAYSAINAKSKESNDWKQKYNTLNANFPKEGLLGLSAQAAQWKKVADQRETSIQQLEKRYKDTIEQRNQEIQRQKEKINELNASIANHRKTITQINPLRHNLTLKNKEVETLQKQISGLNASLVSNKTEIAQLTENLNKTKKLLDSQKTGSQENLQNVRSDYDKNIEILREEKQQLLNQVAEKDRELADTLYADNLIVESIQLMDTNQFPEALSQVQKALERKSGNPMALYYQQRLQGILSDPVEKELYVQLNARKNKMREEIRSRIAEQNIRRSKEMLAQGLFGNSIEIARQTLAFLPSESSEAKLCNQLIVQAEEDESTITRQISEVRGYLEKGDQRKAKSLLKTILRRAPSLEEAKSLEKQIQN